MRKQLMKSLENMQWIEKCKLKIQGQKLESKLAMDRWMGDKLGENFGRWEDVER